MTTKLEKAEKAYKQAKARLEDMKAQERTRQRKLDTRRKIVLGGSLIAEAGESPEAAERLRKRIAGLSERDRALFDDWKP